VPTYLLERKLQLAQEHEARMAAKAAAAIPAGMFTMQPPGGVHCACAAPLAGSSLHPARLPDCGGVAGLEAAPKALTFYATESALILIPQTCCMSLHAPSFAGLRQMPEAERLETLALLQQNRQEVEAKLSALPITVETHSMVRHTFSGQRSVRYVLGSVFWSGTSSGNGWAQVLGAGVS
jgi:hypothetical protein